MGWNEAKVAELSEVMAAETSGVEQPIKLLVDRQVADAL